MRRWREVNEFINASPDGVSPPEEPSVPTADAASAAAPVHPSAAPAAGMAVGAGERGAPGWPWEQVSR